MTAGRPSRRREHATSVRHEAQPTPLPGHVPPARAGPATARARRRLIVTATGIGGPGLLGISLSTKAGSRQFYILTMGLAGTWAAGALSSGPLPLTMPQNRAGARCRPVVMPLLAGAHHGPGTQPPHLVGPHAALPPALFPAPQPHQITRD